MGILPIAEYHSKDAFQNWRNNPRMSAETHQEMDMSQNSIDLHKPLRGLVDCNDGLGLLDSGSVQSQCPVNS